MPTEILKDFIFFERGYLNANHFAFRGEAPVLIDTGYIGDFDRTAVLLRAAGIDPRRIRLIVNTHCHCDHVGGNRTLQEQSGCDIALHPRGKHFMDTRDDWSTWWRYYRQEAEFFRATRALEDGEEIAVGPHVFEIVFTPGHSADGIALFNRKAKILLSSDALWERDMAVMTLKVEGGGALSAALGSLERLAALDARTVYPGHGPAFTGVDRAIARCRRRIEGYLAHPEQVGNDLLKKIIVYTLLMHRGAREDTFFDRLMATEWFIDTVDTSFGGRYRATFDQIIEELRQKKVLQRRAGMLLATVKP